MITAIDTAPVMDLRPPDVDSLVEELQAYHAIYSPLFQRREQRQWSAEYLRGLLLEIPRKSIEPMMLALQGADQNAIRAMQQFVGEGAWNDDAILKRHWREVDETLGDEDGVLTLDGSDFLKQGTESVGVKRQYCGEVGKRANCQAGVFLGYASSAGYKCLSKNIFAYTADFQDVVRCGSMPVLDLKSCRQNGLRADSPGESERFHAIHPKFKYLTKINFIFVAKILDHPFDILNQISKAGIGPKFDPFILHKPPEDLNQIQFGRVLVQVENR